MTSLKKHKSLSIAVLFALIASTVLAGPLFGVGLSPVQKAEAGTTLSPLHVQGDRLVNANGQVVWLKGVDTPSLEWSKTGTNLSQSHYTYISQTWKANVVRIPINQDWALSDSNYLATLDKVLDYTQNAGLYAIVDLHWIGGKQQAMPNSSSVTMWTKLATRWKGRSNVLYDIYNEPFNTSWSNWKPWAEKLIDAVRAGNPSAVCVVGGPDWSYDLSGFGANPINRSNIVLSVHDYPWKVFPREKAYGYLAAKYPILVGEWGGDDSKTSWANTLLSYINANHLNYTAWGFYPGGGGFPSLITSWSYGTTGVGSIVKNDLVKSAGSNSDPAPTPVQAVQIGNSTVTTNGSSVLVKTTVSGSQKVYVKWRFLDPTTLTEITSVTSALTTLGGSATLSASKTLPNGRYEVKVVVLNSDSQKITSKLLSNKIFSLPSNTT
jgi:hypothetical protein